MALVTLDLIFSIIGSQVVFISIFGLLKRSTSPNILTASLRCHLFQCSSLSIILTLCHKARWFPLSFHIWSAIPDFPISRCTTAFWCFCSFTFRGQHVSPLYTWLQLHGMEYTQFLVMFYSFGGLIRKRWLQRVGPLWNVILISYGLHISWIFSAKLK